jgi:PAS domain S-box-containing protein
MNSKSSYEKEIAGYKQTIHSLQESEAQYRRITEQSPIAIEFYDAEGLLVNVNQACLDLFGILNTNEISKLNLFDDPNISDLLKAELREKKQVHYQSIFDFDKVKEFNLYQTSKTGQLWLDILITVIHDPGDKILGF